MNKRTIALLSVISSAVLISAVAGITKKGLEEIPPLTFAALRFVVASLCIVPFFLDKRRRVLSHVREITPLSILGAGNVMLFILGMSFATANVGVVIYAGTPLLAGLFLFFFFKEKLQLRKIIGIIVGFLGVLIIVLLPLLGSGETGSFLGNMILSCSVCIWSLYMVFATRLLKKYSPFTVVSNFIFTTTILLLPFLFWDLEVHAGWWHEVTGWGIAGILYTAIFATIITYILNQYAIKHGGAVFASTTFYITPLLGFLINFFLLGEVLTINFIIGSILALLGTYLVVRK